MSKIKNYLADETAAVTVDWVVLTAAVVGISIAVALTIETGLNSSANTISSNVGTVVADLFGGSGGSGVTVADYIDGYHEGGPDPVAGIIGATPDGYAYTGYYDSETDLPIYSTTGEIETGTLSIGTETSESGTYTGTPFPFGGNTSGW